jgi:hypothetical protein
VVKGELERRYAYYSNDLDVLRPSAVILINPDSCTPIHVLPVITS